MYCFKKLLFLLLMFLLIMTPLFAIGMSIYHWGVRAVQEEINKSMIAQVSFYLNKWQKVYAPSSEPNRIEEYAYFIRFFDSFCRWFGFADVEEIVVPGEYRSVFTVKKTNLLEKVFC